ncbi:hypothetical protein CVT25_004076 [Psilocybe cyanescens]|uniref:Solute carrier family 40 protein n=1 Tax=Psilocybe cyanescens TaxID=93625 RepID=A0A409XPV4_PSICY|nr:hypothetical protein CVT25_004076 [Psilocybe cyanescens]
MPVMTTVSSSTHSLRIKLLVAWLWVSTTTLQGLTTAQDYVLWEFINPDSAAQASALTNATNLISSLVAASSQAFCVHRIWKGSGEQFLIPTLSIPPILLQIAVSLGSIVSPFVIPLSPSPQNVSLTVYKGLRRSGIITERKIPAVAQIVLLCLNTGVWTVVASLSNIIMFYFLFSYSSLFVLYSHLTTSIYFLTVMSLLESTPNDQSLSVSASLRSTHPRSIGIAESIRFKHPTSVENGQSDDGF